MIYEEFNLDKEENENEKAEGLKFLVGRRIIGIGILEKISQFKIGEGNQSRLKLRL